MKKTKYLFALLWLILALPGCSRQRQFVAPELTTFYEKADLSTEQIYIRLAEKNQLNHDVSLFIKCSDCSPVNLDSLKEFATLGPVNENIITAKLPAHAIPAVADFAFVIALEGAKSGKLWK